MYLSTWPREKPAAVGAFFADDLGAVGEARVVDQQRTAFAGDDVLGFVEAQRAEVRRSLPSARAAIGRQMRLRGVLDDRMSCRAAIATIASISQPTPA